MIVAGTLNEPGTVTISGVPAVVDASNNFRGTVPTTTGTNTFTIVARDASGNQTTQTYEVEVAGSTKTFTYDANGNLTADGTRSFEWDARNQLIAVNVGTHRSEFSYDGEKRRVRVVEKENSVVQSDTKVIWCRSEICEERAADGTTITRRPFRLGEQANAAVRFFAANHLSSVGEITDTTGTLATRYEYDPWGRRTVIAGTDVTNTGYTGHQWLSAPGLSMTQHRGYEANLGRWLSEDPTGLGDGLNMYAYVKNKPIGFTDPTGQWAVGAGISGTAAAVIFLGPYVEAGCLAVADSQGNVGLLCCSVGGPNNGFLLGVGWQVEGVACPQCKSICDLAGPCFGYNVTLAKGVGVSGGGGVCIGSSGAAITVSAGPAAAAGGAGGPVVGGCSLKWKRKECCQ
jgi:RHS repeat-associated protein